MWSNQCLKLHFLSLSTSHMFSLLLVLFLVQSLGGTCSLKILQDIYLLLVSLNISKTYKLFTVQSFYICENRLTNLDWCKWMFWTSKNIQVLRVPLKLTVFLFLVPNIFFLLSFIRPFVYEALQDVQEMLETVRCAESSSLWSSFFSLYCSWCHWLHCLAD